MLVSDAAVSPTAPAGIPERVIARVAGVFLGVVVLAALVLAYAVAYVAVSPAPITAPAASGGVGLVLETVPSYGHGPEPDWVTYMGRDASSRWQHTTIYRVPAHTLVTVTLYQLDTSTGLRNPFLAMVRGTEGGTATLDGRPFRVVNADDASHTSTVPDLGLSVPLPGISSNASNVCSAGPCSQSLRGERHPTETELVAPLAAVRPSADAGAVYPGLMAVIAVSSFVLLYIVK